ncbi:MAG: Panacea domain-containing protein [Fibromonadales bacterium]|nr:Panacea domain-containing protein [Fibromonadales bacterium]
MAIRFNMNKEKAIECVLWLIERGESNMYNIWKMLFTAEKYSLNNYASPITGDVYRAMKHGTVPRKLYEIANSNTPTQGDGFYRDGNTLIRKKCYESGWLSDYDLVSLQVGFNEYNGLTFNQVEKKNHKEKCWKKNYAKNASKPIPFEDIIEKKWVLEELRGISHRMVL